MRQFLLLVIAILLFSTFWFRQQQILTQRQLTASTDSLAHFILDYKASGKWPALDSIIGSKPSLNDTTNEVHRIVWRISLHGFSFLVRENKNHLVQLEYKRFSIQNPLTGKGFTKVHFEKTIPVPAETFHRFRQQLSSVSFFDASRNEDYMCCFSTGSINWEALFQNGQYLSHSTFCRQSVQFAEACEMMMRLVDDPELQGALGHAVE